MKTCRNSGCNQYNRPIVAKGVRFCPECGKPFKRRWLGVLILAIGTVLALFILLLVTSGLGGLGGMAISTPEIVDEDQIAQPDASVDIPAPASEPISLDPTPPPYWDNVYVEYILDASGSMQEELDGVRKIEIAKEVLASKAGQLPSITNVGLRVYGHRIDYQDDKEGSCRDIELMVPPVRGGRDRVLEKLPTLNALGMTPLSESVIQSVNDFDYNDPFRHNSLVVISDGEETCGGNPCSMADDLINVYDINFTMYVIGFDILDNPTAQAQLQCLADKTGGVFLQANNRDELAQALDGIWDTMDQRVAADYEEQPPVAAVDATATGEPPPVVITPSPTEEVAEVDSSQSQSQDPNLPKGLSRGVWITEGEDGPDFWFLRDGKTLFGGFGTYELVHENTLKVIFPKRGDVFRETSEIEDSDDKLLLTITDDSAPEPERSVVIRKVIDDTSTGNYEKDLLGKWYFIDDINKTKRTMKFLEDGTGVITADESGKTDSFIYEIIEDKLTLTTYHGKEEFVTFQIINMGDLIVLSPERGNREVFLAKSSEILECFIDRVCEQSAAEQAPVAAVDATATGEPPLEEEAEVDSSQSQSQDPNLPKGLSRGAWVIEGRRSNYPRFWFLRDGKMVESWKWGFGTYELVDENTLKAIFSSPENQEVLLETSEWGDSDDKLLVTITSNSSSERFVIRKVIDDTSTGNVEKELLGKWQMFAGVTRPTMEFLEDGTGVITAGGIGGRGERETFTYEVIGDQLTLTPDDPENNARTSQIISLGDPILLGKEGSNNVAWLVKSSEILEMFKRR